MINLLPKSEKEKILKEKRKKLIVILNFLILFSLFSFLLSLLIIKVTICGEINSEKVKIEGEKRIFENLKLKEIEKKLKEENINISKISKILTEKIYISEILEKISEILPEGIYLKSVSFTKNLEKKTNRYYWTISVSGFSKDRISLFKLKKNLEKEKNFSDLNFPPSNWLVPENISFRFSFKIWRK